jgi:hypothetical protein
MAVVRHMLRVIRPLERMPIEFVAPVDVPRIGTVDYEHAAAEIRFRCFDKQVVMVRQQTEPMAEPAEALDGSCEMPQKRQIVPLVVEECLSSVAAGRDVMEPAGYLDACAMSHPLTVESESMQPGCNFVATWLRKCNRNLASARLRPSLSRS